MTELGRLLGEDVGATRAPGPDLDREPLDFRQGTVVSWNSATNENVIDVHGTPVPNVAVLSTADSLLLRPGDVVGVLRHRERYFIVGRLTLPGITAALGMQVATVSFPASTSSTTPTDIPGSLGPRVSDVYVGSSRRVLVLASALVSTPATANSAFFQVTVTGATSTSGAGGTLTTNQNVVQQATITAVDLLSVTNQGMNEGLNTFTVQYSVTGGTATFASRKLIVMPF